MLIDFHTHIFPPDVRDHRERYCVRDAWFNELYSNPRANIATAEDLVAVRVVEMEMRVDDRAHRLVGDALDLVEQHPRRGGRDVIVDQHDVVLVDDDGGVADDRQRACADGVVDPLLDLVEPKGLTSMRRSGRLPLSLRRNDKEEAEATREYKSFQGRLLSPRAVLIRAFERHRSPADDTQSPGTFHYSTIPLFSSSSRHRTYHSG